MKIKVGLNPYTVRREASVEVEVEHERHHDIRLKSQKTERRKQTLILAVSPASNLYMARE
jgi:hypothetical protein